MSTFTPKDLERAWGLCSDDGWYDHISPERVAQAFADFREECAQCADVEKYAPQGHMTEGEKQLARSIAGLIRELGK